MKLPYLKKIVFLIAVVIPVQGWALMSYTLDYPYYPGITSNSIIDIAHNTNGIWLGTGAGASFSGDSGTNWQTYNESPPLPGLQISALATGTHNDTSYMWVSASHSERIQGDSYPFGDGLVLTKDNGQNWDSVRTPEQCSSYGKLSYDLDIYRNHVYSACFYGGLIRSTNNGRSWQSLFLNSADSLDYSLESYLRLTNRYFSVKVDATLAPETISVWGGSALGINRFIFTNYDSTRFKQDTSYQIYFNAQDTTIPDDRRLPGNFVVALGVNKIDTVSYLWAACRPGGGDAGQRYGVAYSKDRGRTWQTDLELPAWDFAFSGDTVFVAFGDFNVPSSGYGLAYAVRDTDSNDYTNWQIVREMVDATGYLKYFNSPFYAVDIVDGTIWAGGADGTAKSTDGGSNWVVYRSQIDADEHFAYPSPFSPYASERQAATIHYKLPQTADVTLKIYDFNLDLVKTILENQSRPGDIEIDTDLWDGKNDKGIVVANGVYFYNIKLSTGQSWWGKVVIIK